VNSLVSFVFQGAGKNYLTLRHVTSAEPLKLMHGAHRRTPLASRIRLRRETVRIIGPVPSVLPPPAPCFIQISFIERSGRRPGRSIPSSRYRPPDTVGTRAPAAQ
jgi:hypothetical protein